MPLRRAIPADAQILAERWYAMLEEDGLVAPEIDPSWHERLAADFAAGIESGSQVWYAIEEEGALVACGAAFVRRDAVFTALMGVQATLGGIYTLPAYRRRGCARAIVTALLRVGRDEGWEYVRLRASRQGRPLYEQFGFVPGDEMVLPHDAYAALFESEGGLHRSA